MPRPKKKQIKREEAVEVNGGLGTVKITLKCLGRVFKSEGRTVDEAVEKIKISGGARATSVILVEKGDNKKEKILSGSLTNGLFGQGSPSIRAIHLKSIHAVLGI